MQAWHDERTTIWKGPWDVAGMPNFWIGMRVQHDEEVSEMMLGGRN